MSDLLNSLNSKMSNKTDTKQTTTTTDLERGTNLVDKVEGSAKVDGQTSTTKVETKDNKDVKSDSKPWTIESYEKEVHKLREEAKQVRLKGFEQADNLEKTYKAKLEQLEEQYKPYVQAAKELEEFRKKEDDKKRDVAEKLAHREAMLADISAKQEAAKREYESILMAKEAELAKYRAEHEAAQAVYQSKLEEELLAIPEKFRPFAATMVRGAPSVQDAFILISEAKLNGVFEDKVVTVNHSVPGARDGARTTNEVLEAKRKEELSKMTSQQKVRLALSEIRGGTKNDAFVTKVEK